MSENESEQKKAIIKSLGPKDLDQLSDDQLRMAEQISSRRVNDKALAKMTDVLKDQEGAMLRALTRSPFVYETPPVKVVPEFEIQLSSLLTPQIVDLGEQWDDIVTKGQVQNLAAFQFNLVSLAHGLSRVNGQLCGGVEIPADFPSILRTNREEAKKIISNLRKARMDYLDSLSAPIIDRMSELQRAFQVMIERLTRDGELGVKLGN